MRYDIFISYSHQDANWVREYQQTNDKGRTTNA